MKETIKVRLLLCLIPIWALLLLLILTSSLEFMLRVICLLIGTGLFISLLILIVWPYYRMQSGIERLEDDVMDEETLKQITKDIPSMEPIVDLIRKYAEYQTRKSAAQIFNKQTELAALQSQINPHFLYNTLESIRGQALMDDNYDIACMVEALSAFFRYSISGKDSFVTLRDELKNIENYMLIQRYRFKNRFSMEILIEEEDEVAYDYLIPKLIIQPIVENAIYHGLEEVLEGGKVTIEVIVTEETMIITISNNGKGIEAEQLDELNARIHSELSANDESKENEENRQKRHDTGIALTNIHKRITLLFGEDYGLNIYSTVGQGTDVELTLPANYKRE